MPGIFGSLECPIKNPAFNRTLGFLFVCKALTVPAKAQSVMICMRRFAQDVSLSVSVNPRPMTSPGHTTVRPANSGGAHSVAQSLRRLKVALKGRFSVPTVFDGGNGSHHGFASVRPEIEPLFPRSHCSHTFRIHSNMCCLAFGLKSGWGAVVIATSARLIAQTFRAVFDAGGRASDQTTYGQSAQMQAPTRARTREC